MDKKDALRAVFKQVGCAEDCNLDEAMKIASDYPDHLDVLNAYNQVSKNLKKPTPDVGSEADWTGPQPETKESYNQAFGTQKCNSYIARFSRGNGPTLSFVGTVHTEAHPEAEDEVDESIRKQFESQKPDVIIIEKPPQALSCEEMLRIYSTPLSKNESEYAARLALHAGKKLVSGESEEDQWKGVPPADQGGFEFLRAFKKKFDDSKRTQGGDLHGQEEMIFNQIKSESQNPNNKLQAITFPQFLEWYRTKNCTEPDRTCGFSIKSVDEDIAPSGGLRDPTRARGTNKLAEIIVLNRDQTMLNTIRSQMLAGSNVMAVFGKDHLETELPVFRKVFGPGLPSPVASCRITPLSRDGIEHCQ